MARPWFDVQWPEADTAVISEPLHWEQPHCYLLLGTRRALLIDTGLGVGGLAAQIQALTDLPVLAAVTHAHWDHIGGLGGFARRAVHEAEAPWLAGHFPLPPEAVRAQLTRASCPFPPGFDALAYRVFGGGATQFLHDGQVLDLGGRQIQVCHTPGHSPGHVCFWEAARGALFSGDLFYQGQLDMFYPTTDPAVFLLSAQKMDALNARHIWPGHYALPVPPDLAGRVAGALAGLQRAGRLCQGAGLFPCGDFSLRL